MYGLCFSNSSSTLFYWIYMCVIPELLLFPFYILVDAIPSRASKVSKMQDNYIPHQAVDTYQSADI